MGHTEPGTRARSTHPNDGELSGGGSFARYMEHLSTAFAVTEGAEHRLVYANAAFRRLTGTAAPPIGRPIADSFVERHADGLVALLDRAFHGGGIARDRHLGTAGEQGPSWCCTVWPQVSLEGETEHLLIELREAPAEDLTLALQRDVAERMLLSALRERDLARDAEASSRRATFLAVEGRRLAGSLDEEATMRAVSGVSLPYSGDWSIVDILDADGAMHRLAVMHSDPATQKLLGRLEGRWTPALADAFGVPAMLRHARPTIIADRVDAVLAGASEDPELLRILHEVGAGALLTVPLVIREQLVGAITFVSGQRDRSYTSEDVELARDLATRSALALDSARLHGDAIALKVKAETASKAKSAFLGTMSHELRTPLNAIGGYVDLIDMGLRGPVSEAQHTDLARIRRNQRHLIALVTDVLNFVRLGSGQLAYEAADVVVHRVVAAAVALVEPLMLEKRLAHDGVQCDDTLVARADWERVMQILVNLFSNAIKFTPAGGRISIACSATDDTVLLRIADTGIGIPPSKLETIFEPFVQVREGLAGRDTGVGLGLAISRDLARGMGGDLRAESVEGKGSTFILSFPRAGLAAASAGG